MANKCGRAKLRAFKCRLGVHRDREVGLAAWVCRDCGRGYTLKTAALGKSTDLRVEA